MTRLRQPTLGILATLLIMIISLAFISLFDWVDFSGWVSFLLICSIPATVVVGVTWGSAYPASTGFRRQPLRGMLLLLIVLVVALVVAALHFFTVGGGVNPPVPMLSQCIIISVPITFWLTVMWGGWPFVLIPNRLLAGASLLAGCYLVNYLLFRLFFNYDFMRGAPIYRAELDPAGLFDAWNATTFSVTFLAVMFLMLSLDLWPLSRFGSLMRQPILGLAWTAIVVVLATGLFALGTDALGMAAPDFLVRVPIPFIFGSVVVLTMLDNSLFQRYPQPLKGICNILAATLIGSVLTLLYGALGPVVTGPLTSGPPTFDVEVWVASALLAVTFPFLAYFSDLFQKWPLRKVSPPHDATAPPVRR